MCCRLISNFQDWWVLNIQCPRLVGSGYPMSKIGGFGWSDSIILFNHVTFRVYSKQEPGLPTPSVVVSKIGGFGWSDSIILYNHVTICICSKQEPGFLTPSVVVSKIGGFGWSDSIILFNHVTFCICSKQEPGFPTPSVVVFIYDQWFKVRGNCSFCWYWWSCWPSLYTLFIADKYPGQWMVYC